MAKLVTGFRFTGSSTLGECRAYGAVADTHKRVTPIDAGELIVVLASRPNKTYLAMIGIATGEVLSTPPSEIWAEWEGTDRISMVFGVKWASDIVVVPAEIASRPTNRMSEAHASAVFDYVLSAT